GKALAVGAAKVAQAVALLGRVDTLGDRLDPETPRYADDDGHGGMMLRLGRHAADQHPVDLEQVDGKIGAVRERRTGESGVLHGEADTGRPELLQGGTGWTDGVDGRDLAQSQAQPVRRHAGVVEDPEDGVRRARRE